MVNDVRMVQIFHRGWDQHFNIADDLPNQYDVDQVCYGLIQDLKQRGLLDDTLVIWGSEFGRTNYSQGKLTREIMVEITTHDASPCGKLPVAA